MFILQIKIEIPLDKKTTQINERYLFGSNNNQNNFDRRCPHSNLLILKTNTFTKSKLDHS